MSGEAPPATREAEPVGSMHVLHGTWRLLSWSRIAADGNAVFPFTEHAAGRLNYGTDGWMSVFLMHPEWAEYGRVDGFIAYSGRFDMADDRVRHLIDFATIRAMTGTVQDRVATIVDGRLRLEAIVEEEPGGRHVLEWTRAPV